MWLKDGNGARYRIAAITSVTPLEMKDDKNDRNRVTRTLAAVGLAGGGTFHTTLDFNDVVAAVDPPPAPAPKQEQQS